MKFATIQEAMLSVESYFRDKASPGPQADVAATAVVESGLKCRIESPDGKMVYSDMPAGVGGDASANSPGWLMRAAVASCDATLLTMRAARLGLELDRVEVRVEAMSDGRGMFLDEGISAGSSEMRICFRVAASELSENEIRELVDWTVAHSPVGTDIARAVDVKIEIVNL